MIKVINQDKSILKVLQFCQRGATEVHVGKDLRRYLVQGSYLTNAETEAQRGEVTYLTGTAD